MNEDGVNPRFFGELVFDEFSDFGFVAKVGAVVEFIGGTKRTDFACEGGLELIVGHNGSGRGAECPFGDGGVGGKARGEGGDGGVLGFSSHIALSVVCCEAVIWL